MLQETFVNVMPFDAAGFLRARSSAAMALTMSIEDCNNSIFKEWNKMQKHFCVLLQNKFGK